MSPSKYSPDFRLDGYEAASDAVEEHFCGRIEADEDMLTALAEHHSADTRHSFHILHDRTATWGIPGEPQIIALHIARDPGKKTFTFEHAMLPLPAMAQSWLVSRGCPREGIRLPPGMGTASADEATTALQDLLIRDGHRFALIDSYTNDSSNRPQVTVLLRALDDKDGHPFRVLVEEADLAQSPTPCAKSDSPPMTPPSRISTTRTVFGRSRQQRRRPNEPFPRHPPAEQLPAAVDFRLPAQWADPGKAFYQRIREFGIHGFSGFWNQHFALNAPDVRPPRPPCTRGVFCARR